MRYKELVAHIQVDGVPLEEYGTICEAGNVLTCWVASEEGKVRFALDCLMPLADLADV